MRTTQNWVGGSSFTTPSPRNTVPPAPEEVEGLLEDLAVYINRDDVPAIIQAAVAHAQFESVPHPFADGNGRCGRALHADCAATPGNPGQLRAPPISLALAAAKGDYLQALRRYAGIASPRRRGGCRPETGWVSVFCECALWPDDMDDIRRDLRTVGTRWEERLSGGVPAWVGREPHAGRGSCRRCPTLPARPAWKKPSGAARQAVALAVAELLECGVVAQNEQGKAPEGCSRRCFPDILEEFNLVERRLASPARDTSSCRPKPPCAGTRVTDVPASTSRSRSPP